MSVGGTVAYQYRLPGFEGPLDVLLRLIERQELDITVISLAAVADQFLAYVESCPSRDPAQLADFAAIASRLLLIKTRMLFPRLPSLPTTADDESDGADLVHHLREYQRIRALADGLAAREQAGLRAFAPLSMAAEPSRLTPLITLAPSRADDLIGAVQRRLSRAARPPGVLTLRPRISLGEMIALIGDRLQSAREARFSSLIVPFTTRVEVVTAFIAILELVRRRRIDAAQARAFGDIVLCPIVGSGEVERAMNPGEAADD